MEHISDELSERDPSPEDVDWLVELRLATMREHFERSGQMLSSADQRSRVLQDFSSIRILQSGDLDVGMMKVVRSPEVWRLVQIQLLPQYQRRGLGAFLVGGLLKDARRAGVAVSLHVLKVNPARRLYERLGFQVVSDHGHSYEMRVDA